MAITTLFIGTDIDVPIDISGIAIDDITDISLILRKTKQADIVLTKLGGEITISGGDITARISKTAVTVPGNYQVRITVTDIGGKIRGLNANPARVTFE